MRIFNHPKMRFVLVGGMNTLVDITLYGLLAWLGLSIIVANFVSTSVGVLVSYVLNKNFTFQVNNNRSIKQMAVFLVVTLFGLWAIQPVIILASTPIIENVFSFLPTKLMIMAPKCIATGVTLIWNYMWYSKIIFKN